MKLYKIKVFLSLFTLFALLMACSDDIENEGQEIPPEDITAYRPPCEWKDMDMNKVYVINSEDDMKSFLDCDIDLFLLDFNKHSILVASGLSSKEIGEVRRKLIRQSKSNYRLIIEVIPRIDVPIHIPSENEWHISLQIPKIPNDSQVELVINYIN